MTVMKKFLFYGTAAILGLIWALYAQHGPVIPNLELRELIARLLI
jgi:hypothetical protein